MKQTVDFFIVGEPKSGTTALAHFLGQHPAIGISTPKEPHYFASDLHRECDAFHGPKNHHFPIRTRKQYLACFAPVADRPMWAEGSTHYMYSTEAATNIHRHNPDAKIIIMLRNPVDFVHSLHMQYVNNGNEDEPDFARALSLEPARRRGQQFPPGVRCPSHLYYSERVQFAEHLARYLQQYPANQIKVIIMEEFTADNQQTYLETLDFLGLEPPAELPHFAPVHDSKTPRFKALHRTLNRPAMKRAVLRAVGANHYDRVKDAAALLVMKRQSRDALSPELRQQLQAEYEPAVRQLAKLLDRPDLPALWGYDA